MRTKILEAIAHLNKDNWNNTQLIRETVFEKLFGKREKLKNVNEPTFYTRFTPGPFKNRLINASDFGMNIFSARYVDFQPELINELYGDVVLIQHEGEDYTISHFVDDIKELRKETKKQLNMTYITGLREGVLTQTDVREKLQDVRFQLKIIKNFMFSMFGWYDYGVEREVIRQRMNQIIMNDAAKIIRHGGHILTINVDTIVFVAESIPGLTYYTHNNMFNCAYLNGVDGGYIQVNPAAEHGMILTKMTDSLKTRAMIMSRKFVGMNK